MIEYFSNRETEYEEWCVQHPHGFIFNHAGGQTGNVMHRVRGCYFISADRFKGIWTTRYPKYCSEYKTILALEADRVSKPFPWRECKYCFG